jgi:hypothetical protein
LAVDGHHAPVVVAAVADVTAVGDVDDPVHQGQGAARVVRLRVEADLAADVDGPARPLAAVIGVQRVHLVTEDGGRRCPRRRET